MSTTLSGNKRLLGIDVSSHQGIINWAEVAAYPDNVYFTGIRTGISWAYVDSFFKTNWIEAKAYGILRAAYHVLYPLQPVERQMDNFLKIIGDDLGEFPLVLDLELVHGALPAQIQSSVWVAAKYLKSKTGKYPIIYSRKEWIDFNLTKFGAPPAWLNDFYWWLAHYTKDGSEHPGPPPVPKGVDASRVIVHQTSDRQSSIGSQAKTTDRNRWQAGNEESLYDFVGMHIPDILTYEDKVDILWDFHPGIHP